MYLQKTAYNSALRAYSPQSKIIIGLALLLACLLLNSVPVSAALIIAFCFINVVLGKIKPLKYLGLLMIPLGFLVLGTLTVVFRPAPPEGALLSFSVFGACFSATRDSLIAGAALILRSLGAVSCMYFIALNTLISDISAALLSFRFPKLFVALTELVYRYIFVVLDELTRVKTAQESRLGYVSLKTGMNSMGRLFGSLFIRCMVRSDNMYNALASRGFDGGIPMLAGAYKSSGAVWLSGAAGCACLCALRLCVN